MDATAKDSEQLHRVKRVYVKKAAPVADTSRADALAFVVAIQEQDAGYGAAMSYALRVWAGQSIDLPLSERKERVLNALRGQSLPTDGLTFTAEGIA